MKSKIFIFTLTLLTSSLIFAGWVWIDDATITDKVRTKYLENSAINAWNIDVITHNGQVKLTGHANSFTQLHAAVKLASETEGVEDINVDEVTVEKSNNQPQDAKITAKIYAELIKSKLLEKNHPNHAKIMVETVDANVFISGHVKDDVEEKYIIATIESVKDVRTVTSFLDKQSESRQ
jgi:osmotically-inducible protein OsmY